MGQVTIYLEDDLEQKMRSAAKTMNLPQSKWIAGVIKEKLVDDWPDSVRETAGSWSDFPDLEEIRSDSGSDSVTDAKRENL